MKRNHFITALLACCLCLALAACQKASVELVDHSTHITLSDEEITVSGNAISTNPEDAVYAANDIIFYLEDQGFTYGAGTKEDEHSQAEADEHTVVHITKPGTYTLSGSLSMGQIAIDLGDDAKENPEAVVTLVLNNVDIQCTVAPAVIFYNVYECGSDDIATASESVDTSAAGANVIIADDSANHITGSYVARIYKSYELNEAGTEVVSNKKLHKYDGAFYSKRSMNVYGGEKGNGVLYIDAENEGLDSELHLTIHGGQIYINSGNDGINTNEDEVSVTTINGGLLNIVVNGSTGEGDGIDSNGWIVIHGGTVIAQACDKSGDSGIDSDMGIHIQGGTVIATGNMLDRLEDNGQTYAVFRFSQSQSGNTTYTLKNAKGETVLEHNAANAFTYLVVSSPDLTEGDYSLWAGDTALLLSSDMGSGMMGGFGGGERPEMPEGFQPGERPEMPEDFQPGERPEMPESDVDEASTVFSISAGGNMFRVS